PEPQVRRGAAGFADSDLGEAGVPRRVRQANLAPQLRDTTAKPAPGSGGDDVWTRSPEATRSTSTAIQQGWDRGRSVFDVPAAGPVPGAGTGGDSGAGTGASNGGARGAAARARDGSAMPAPDAEAAGTYRTEPEREDGGMSG